MEGNLKVEVMLLPREPGQIALALLGANPRAEAGNSQIDVRANQ